MAGAALTPWEQEQSPSLAIKLSPAAPGAIPAPCGLVSLCPRGGKEDSSSGTSSCLGAKAEPQRGWGQHPAQHTQHWALWWTPSPKGRAGDLGSSTKPLEAALRLPASKSLWEAASLWGLEGMGSSYFWSRYFPSPLLCTQAGKPQPSSICFPCSTESPARHKHQQTASAPSKQREEKDQHQPQ